MSDAESSEAIFGEVPEGLDETWTSGLLVGGMARWPSDDYIARSYKTAADSLLRHANEYGESWEVGYPMLFLYRHAVELYLKAVLGPVKLTHDLDQLANGFEYHVEERFGQKVPSWFMQHLRDFATIAPSSETFRYAKTRGGRKGARAGERFKNAEVWVDLKTLAGVMARLAEGFERILSEIRRRKDAPKRSATLPT